MKTVGLDLGEPPAQHISSLAPAQLHDVGTLRPADLARIILLQRIVPMNVPSVLRRIVDAQGGAVKAVGQVPDILNRTAIEDPAGVDFSAFFHTPAIGAVKDAVDLPTAGEKSVEVDSVSIFGRGRGREQLSGKRRV